MAVRVLLTKNNLSIYATCTKRARKVSPQTRDTTSQSSTSLSHASSTVQVTARDVRYALIFADMTGLCIGAHNNLSLILSFELDRHGNRS